VDAVLSIPSSFRTSFSCHSPLGALNHQQMRMDEVITDAKDDAGRIRPPSYYSKRGLLPQNAEQVAPFQAPGALIYKYVCHVSPKVRRNGQVAGSVSNSDDDERERKRSSTTDDRRPTPLPSHRDLR
jgi:hypothetical protein